MEDIFEEATVRRLRNISEFKTVETKTLLAGRCYTACRQYKTDKMEMVVIRAQCYKKLLP
jgi:hypothetical protein